MASRRRRPVGLLMRFLARESVVPQAPIASEHQAPEMTKSALDSASPWLPSTAATRPSTGGHVSCAAAREESADCLPEVPGARWLLEDQQPARPASGQWFLREEDPDGAHTAGASQWLAAETASAGTLGREPAPARSPWILDERAGFGTAAGPPDPAAAERAARAYCRDVCDPAHVEQAVTESLRRFEAATNSSGAGQNDLLRIVRASAAERAFSVQGRPTCPSGEEHEDECEATPTLLAMQAIGKLDSVQQANLEKQLIGCLHCRAVELKMERAERAFATTLASRRKTNPEVRDPEAESV